MKYDGDYGDHDILVTFDIETTHYDPDDGETVAIGVGQHVDDGELVRWEYPVLGTVATIQEVTE